jgi:hypothetical protein
MVDYYYHHHHHHHHHHHCEHHGQNTLRNGPGNSLDIAGITKHTPGNTRTHT